MEPAPRPAAGPAYRSVGGLRSVLAGVLAAVAVAAGGCAASGGAGASSGEPGEGATGLLYAPNQGDATVSVIEVPGHELVETVDLRALGYGASAKPHDVVAAPDGSAWYVSLINANTVLKLNGRNEVVGRAEFEVPGMMALSPDGGTLYVGRSMSAVDPPQRLGVVRTSDMSVEEREVLVPRPHAVAVGPGGRFAHTASLAVNRLATLEAASGEVELAEVDGPTHVMVQFAVSPDGSRMVATGQKSGRLLVFDRTEPRQPALLTTVPVGAEPWHPVYTPDGRYVVFGNKADDTISIVDAGSWTVAAVVEHPGLSQPHGAAVSPDGRYVYVSNNNLDGAWSPGDPAGGPEGDGAGDGPPPGNVAVIDLEARSVVGVIPVGPDPNGLGLRPLR